jgi:hypothetical protein
MEIAKVMKTRKVNKVSEISAHPKSLLARSDAPVLLSTDTAQSRFGPVIQGANPRCH